MGIQLVLISGFLHSLAIIIISDKAQLFARTVMRKDRLQKTSLSIAFSDFILQLTFNSEFFIHWKSITKKQKKNSRAGHIEKKNQWHI